MGPILDSVLRAAGIIPTDPPSLKAAAQGNAHSLRSYANAAYGLVDVYGDDPDVVAVAYVEAITFARLAAALGEDRDREALLFLLSRFAGWQQQRGRHDLAIRFEAASLNVASDLADDGREDMAEMVSRAGDLLSPETFQEAKRQREHF